MNFFSGKFLSNVFRAPVSGKFQKTKQQASLLKPRKESEGQKEILACGLQNGCSKIAKAQGECLCRSPVLEMLPRNFIKTGFDC